jgi:hypothetical protein
MEKRQAGAERPRESAQDARESQKAGASLVAELARRRAAADAPPPDAPPQSQTPQIDAPAPGKSPPPAKAESPVSDACLQRTSTLVANSIAIEETPALDAGAVAYMARMLVLVTLPHRDPKSPTYQRNNGTFWLTMTAEPQLGMPFGKIPRLLMYWVTTEAVRTGKPELELGDTLAVFMDEIGMPVRSHSGGEYGSITRFRNQAARLFGSTVSYYRNDKGHIQLGGMRIAEEADLWWAKRDLTQASLWESKVLLSQPFFKEVTQHPVPVDKRAIKALRKHGCMALDIYTWLTYRMASLKEPTTVPWAALQGQFGAGYGRTRDFKAEFLKSLKPVHEVYRHVKASAGDDGLTIAPSLTHVPKRGGG